MNYLSGDWACKQIEVIHIYYTCFQINAVCGQNLTDFFCIPVNLLFDEYSYLCFYSHFSNMLRGFYNKIH